MFGSKVAPRMDRSAMKSARGPFLEIERRIQAQQIEPGIVQGALLFGNFKRTYIPVGFRERNGFRGAGNDNRILLLLGTEAGCAEYEGKPDFHLSERGSETIIHDKTFWSKVAAGNCVTCG